MVETEPRAARSRWRPVLLLLCGLAVLQTVWIVTIPPFRAIDEFDHAYRAANVASGNWQPATEPAQNGRGRLVEVPASLVDAAHKVCAAYEYTGHDNCSPARVLGNGQVLVASAATDQAPFFYALVGLPSRVAHGAASLYVMRASAALLCLALFALALWSVMQWATTEWPFVAFLLASTPIVIYSSVIPAGNGPEMIAGIGFWCALIGLIWKRDPAVERRLLFAGTVQVAVLCSLRQLGPTIAVAILILVICAAGRHRALEVARDHRWVVLAATAAATITSAAQYAWVYWARTYPAGTISWGLPASTSQPLEHPNPIARTLVWFAQTFAAFPTRTEPSPGFVYGILMILTAAFWVFAIQRASGRLRRGLLLTALASVTFPWAVSILLWNQGSWQGRYAIAISAGCVLLGGLAFERRDFDKRLSPRLAMLVTGLMAVAFGGAALGVLPRVAPNPPAVVVFLLTMLGWTLLGGGIAVVANGRHSHAPEPSYV